MKNHLMIALIAGLTLSPLHAFAGENKPLPAPLPFAGETMKFDVGWEFVIAGTATMHFSNRGKRGYRIDTDARTNEFFDMFKKVRDTITSEGEFVNNRPQSTLLELDQNERSYHASKKSEFLWQKGKVRYTQGNKTDIYDVPAGHLNVMDAFYLTRTLPVVKDKVLKIPVFDSRKQYEIEVRLIKREKLQAPWGKMVDCLVIEPKLKSEGIFTSVGTMQIWVTDDARRIPLKMTAKIKIGRIIARLTDYKAPGI